MRERSEPRRESLPAGFALRETCGVNVNDVGMIERGSSLGLLYEAAPALGVLELFGGQDLQCDKTVQVRILCLPYHAHAAFTELLEDVIVQERPPGHARLPDAGFVYHTSGKEHLNVDGILQGKRYLIHDRDPLYTAEFLTMLQGVGVKSVKLPPRSPNLNAFAERFVRSIKESCLERMILFGEESLRTAIQNFVAHYHSERNHQGLANRLILPEAGHLGNTGTIQRRQRLGGMLNYYYRTAA
jgi:hypothetical protein